MTETKLTPQEAYEKLKEACAKFELWSKLYDSDLFDIDGFDINSEAKEELTELKETYNTPELVAQFDEECKGLTTFEAEVKTLEEQVLFNDITDNADPIYGDILKYAKMIAPHLQELGLEKEKFEIYVHNMGIIKTDIDDDKEGNEEFAGEKIYPETEKVEPLLDEDLTKYLFE